MLLQPGEIVEGKYRIVRTIGEGGMGAVYEGENTRINRRVAIKVLHQAFTGNEEVLRRFEREAQAAGHIGNDHILEVIDLGSLTNGDYFMVMEYLDGEPLSSRIQRNGRLTPQELAPLAKQLLEGLGAAHRAGIVHRDLKPDNIFVLKQKAGVRDFIKIIDFGISKFQPLSGDGMKMTRTGAVMGTPYYMSPEQASGSREADARSDLYSIGVILYEAVTGRVPFDASTFNQLMFKIVLSEIPPPQSVVPDLDPAFATIVLKAMARDVDHRFQTADELSQAIQAWEQGGVAVSVPPPDASNLVPEGSGGRAQMLSSAGVTPEVGTGTPGSWAQDEVKVPKNSAAPLVAALAIVGLLGVGAVVTGVLLASGGMGQGRPAANVEATSDTTSPSTADSTSDDPAAGEPTAGDPDDATNNDSADGDSSDDETNNSAAEDSATNDSADPNSAANDSANTPDNANTPNSTGTPATHTPPPKPTTPTSPPPKPTSPKPSPASPPGPVDFGY